jgi:hypothetical protein
MNARFVPPGDNDRTSDDNGRGRRWFSRLVLVVVAMGFVYYMARYSR